MANIIDYSETLLHGITTGSQFGFKGIAGGAALGIGSLSLINHIDTTDKENNGGEATIKGAMMKGFVTGSVASGITTGFDLYSFKHPNSVPSFKSMNKGNDVTGDAKKIEAYLNPDTYKNIHKGYKELNKTQSSALDKVLNNLPQAFINEVGVNEHTPEKMFTHAAKRAMLTGDDPLKAIEPTLKGLSLNPKEMIKAPVGNVVNRVKDVIYSAKSFDSKSSKEGSPMEKSDKLLNEQMADHVRTHSSQYDEMIKEYTKVFPNNHIKTTEELAKFFESNKPGADAKHEMITREVYDNPNVKKITKGVTAFKEVMDGSPLWSKALIHQQKYDKISINQSKDAEGKLIREIEGSKISKAVRGLAVAGDIAAGGIAMAGIYGAGAAIRHVLKKNPKLDSSTIDSNNSIEPLY